MKTPFDLGISPGGVSMADRGKFTLEIRIRNKKGNYAFPESGGTDCPVSVPEKLG